MATLREVKKRIRTVASRLTFVVIVLTLLTASSSFGFDGLRRGFVLGGGIGIAPTANWKIDETSLVESSTGLGLNFFMGYGLDGRNVFVTEINSVFWQSDFFQDRNILQGFYGGTWYHYFHAFGNSAFTTLGLGLYTFGAGELDHNSEGLGLLAGAGYEFSKRWQAGAYFSYGKTSDTAFDYDHLHVNVLVGAVAF